MNNDKIALWENDAYSLPNTQADDKVVLAMLFDHIQTNRLDPLLYLDPAEVVEYNRWAKNNPAEEGA